jgi:hypothetical protein
MAKLSTMLELYCPGLFADAAFAEWLNEWAGLGLATWHCQSDVFDPPGEGSDVFVTYDHGAGDSHPDNEAGMPRHAWEFVARKVNEHRLDYCLVRLINCEGRGPTDDYRPDEDAAVGPVVIDNFSSPTTLESP